MKIAMIGQKVVPSREGGIEVVVTELAPLLVQMGHQVDCYNRYSKGDPITKKVSDYKGVRLFRVTTPKSSSLNAIVYAFLACMRALFKKYDIIHFHAEGPAFMTFFTHLFKIKSVVTVHGLDWQRPKWQGFAKKFLHFSEKTLVKYADQIIVLTKHNQDYFLNTYQRKTVCIGNGVTLSPPLPPTKIKEQFSLQKEGHYLYLGRIERGKGIHYLIRAFKNLKTTKKLVIAGRIDENDAYLSELRALIQGDKNILFTDFVQGARMQELYSNAFAFVLPSDSEGMPISVLEALSFGTRCILSDVEGNRETAQSHALYFEKGNEKDLEFVLRHAENTPYLECQKSASIAYVKDCFTWQSVAEKTVCVYENTINNTTSTFNTTRA